MKSTSVSSEKVSELKIDSSGRFEIVSEIRVGMDEWKDIIEGIRGGSVGVWTMITVGLQAETVSEE